MDCLSTVIHLRTAARYLPMTTAMDKADPNSWISKKSGSVKIEFHLKKALARAVNLIVYFECDEIVKIE